MNSVILTLLFGSAIVNAATCGNVGQGARASYYVCSGKLVFDESARDAQCPPDIGCTDALCCTDASDYEVVSEPPPRQPREKKNKNIEELGIIPGIRTIAPLFDCNVPSGPNERQKRRYCCLTSGIDCAPKTCAAGAGILSKDESVCCPRECGTCGGVGCFTFGGANCCKTLIRPMGRPCTHYSAPCSNTGSTIKLQPALSSPMSPINVFAPAEPVAVAVAVEEAKVNLCASARVQTPAAIGPLYGNLPPYNINRARLLPGSTAAFPADLIYGASGPYGVITENLQIYAVGSRASGLYGLRNPIYGPGLRTAYPIEC